MQKAIIIDKLSDGSVTHDLIIDDTGGGSGVILLHCKDEESATSLLKALEDYTVDF